MAGRYFCCGEKVGSYGRYGTALSSCNDLGTRFYTVRNGNITNDVLIGQYNFNPAEFFWTDIKFVNGSKFEAVDCDNNIISIDPAAYAPQYILSVFNYMYPGKLEESKSSFSFKSWSSCQDRPLRTGHSALNLRMNLSFQIMLRLTILAI